MNGSKSSWYLIDSNIFLRFLIRDNEEMWQDCVNFFQAIEHDVVHAYIPAIVAAEVQFVLFSFYGFSRSQIITALKSIEAIPNLRVYDDVRVPQAISLYEMKNVKFIDCLISSSERIQLKKATVISYDRDFDKLGVRRVEPKQVLRL
jgi:predicted nucleic-acid-binding protein